jgi:hypothetical protein
MNYFTICDITKIKETVCQNFFKILAVVFVALFLKNKNVASIGSLTRLAIKGTRRFFK